MSELRPSRSVGRPVAWSEWGGRDGLGKSSGLLQKEEGRKKGRRETEVSLVNNRNDDKNI